MEKNISQSKIWEKILTALDADGLKYVLVGGAALAAHGIPRSTLDIDIFVPACEDSLTRLFSSMEKTGLRSRQKNILAFRKTPSLFEAQWVCFAYQKQDVLDVFLCPEKEFGRLFKNSRKKKDRSFSLRVAALEDIRRMKERTGRPQDKADILLIKKALAEKKRINRNFNRPSRKK